VIGLAQQKKPHESPSRLSFHLYSDDSSDSDNERIIMEPSLARSNNDTFINISSILERKKLSSNLINNYGSSLGVSPVDVYYDNAQTIQKNPIAEQND